MTKVRQIGLTTSSKKSVDEQIERVVWFNKKLGRVAVELDYHEVPDAEVRETGCAKWRLMYTFETRPCAKAFWTGEQYH